MHLVVGRSSSSSSFALVPFYLLFSTVGPFVHWDVVPTSAHSDTHADAHRLLLLLLRLGRRTDGTAPYFLPLIKDWTEKKEEEQ